MRKRRHERLGDALEDVERIAGQLSDGTDVRAAGGFLVRRLDPVQQVVGRPVLQASDPAAVFQEFLEEARCAVS